MAELRRTTRGAQVAIDEQFAMWTDYDLVVVNDLTIDYDLVLSVRYDREDDLVRLQKLDIVQRRGGVEVRGTGLRTLRLQDYVRATRIEVAQLDGEGVMEYRDFDGMIAADRRDAVIWSAVRLRWVHRVYRTAQLALRDPAIEVQRRLSLPASTATRWIREARDEGLFNTAPRVLDVQGVIPSVEYVSTVRKVADEVLHGDG